MITLDERLFADLVLGHKSYIIVDEIVKAAIDNSDYGNEHLVCECDPDAVGWSGATIGNIVAAGKTKDGKQLYRLWRRSEWTMVGNTARQRREERDRKCAAVEKAKLDALEDLKAQMRKVGVKDELIEKLLSTMKQEEIRNMLGL
tara:strand:+ start:1538 stop:1972 length:435 start_codon:yes stop_codon:yes gene_type:complete